MEVGPLTCGTITLQHPIGVGTNKWGTDPKKFSQTDISQAFEESLSAGITLLNTAQLYPTSEDCIGNLRKSVPNGERAVIVSKFASLSAGPDKLISSLKESLAKCGVDALDGFLIHHPKGNLSALADQLAEAYHTGLVRNVGVSNFGEKQLREMHSLLATHNVPLIFNEIEFSLLVRAPETNGLLDTCKELGVTVLAWAPLASGRLTQKESIKHISDPSTLALLSELKEIAKTRKKSVAQVALNWCICKGTVPIPGARTRAQAIDNGGAVGWRLTTAEMAKLDCFAVQKSGMYEHPEALYTFLNFWPHWIIRPMVTFIIRNMAALFKRFLPLSEH